MDYCQLQEQEQDKKQIAPSPDAQPSNTGSS